MKSISPVRIGDRWLNPKHIVEIRPSSPATSYGSSITVVHRSDTIQVSFPTERERDEAMEEAIKTWAEYLSSRE